MRVREGYTLIKCPNCQQENLPGRKFCILCEQTLSINRGMGYFWKSGKARLAFLITAIPIIFLSLDASTAFKAPDGGIEFIYGSLLWIGTVLFWQIAFEAAIVIGLRGGKEIAAGIWAGVVIGIVPLGLSSLALLQTWQ
ncbi:MAG: zinc ribbon domain-containing protein [Dehalococcoidales bacterium]